MLKIVPFLDECKKGFFTTASSPVLIRQYALILLHVHTDITLDLDDIIDIYVREYPRRMKL